MRKSDLVITVYQQVYVSGANTKVHVTVTDTDGEVIGRHFSTYEAYPLAKIAAQHLAFMLRALRRSFDIAAVIYDCNVMGRIEHKPKGNGWSRKQISHPRFNPSDKYCIKWTEPEPEEDDETEEVTQ